MKAFPFRSRPLTQEFITAVSSHIADKCYGAKTEEARRERKAAAFQVLNLCLDKDLYSYYRDAPSSIREHIKQTYSRACIAGLDLYIEGQCGTESTVTLFFEEPFEFFRGGSSYCLYFSVSSFPSECHHGAIVIKEEIIPDLLAKIKLYIEIEKKIADLDKDRQGLYLRTYSIIRYYKRLHGLVEAWPEIVDIIKETQYAVWVDALCPVAPEIAEIKELTEKIKEETHGPH